jgi:hypothetical protein
MEKQQEHIRPFHVNVHIDSKSDLFPYPPPEACILLSI